MRREKRRAETIAAIKSLALEQMSEVGAAGINLRAVARDLEMSSAGIYRYYESRDDLLVALIADGFDSLGDAVRGGLASIDGSDRVRLVAAVHAYRRWASSSPQLFALLFTDPVPGFTAPIDGPTDRAVRAAFAPMTAVAVRLIDPGSAAVDPTAVLDVPDRVLTILMGFWASIHGLVSLEVFHHLDWADVDHDLLFEEHVRRSVDQLAATADS